MDITTMTNEEFKTVARQVLNRLAIRLTLSMQDEGVDEPMREQRPIAYVLADLYTEADLDVPLAIRQTLRDRGRESGTT